MRIELHNADSFHLLRGFDENSMDSCPTDPPYELGFMAKKWDSSGIAFTPRFWFEVLRVLKPGAYLAAFGGTRTYHRMAVAIEDAGFEIRDQIGWAFGSGFPKSLNLGNGLGTALKPGWEPICLARKPLIGTVAENVAKYGTGCLNIDACRIPLGQEDKLQDGVKGRGETMNTGAADTEWGFKSVDRAPGLGRWPANICHDGSDEVLAAFPESDGQNGALKGGEQSDNLVFGKYGPRGAFEPRGDSESAARFFFSAKTSRSEREAGLEDFDVKRRSDGRTKDIENPRLRTNARANHHPTVKPIALMRWLVRLITPVGGTAIDPFMGSGSTGVAAIFEDRGFVGIEREAEYFEICKARIREAQGPLFAK